MSWRTVQLAQELCDQDHVILNLFQNQPVQYVGSDAEFAKRLTVSADASNLILILDQPQWCSNVISACQHYLDSNIDRFYIGVNRYTLLGNDTNWPVAVTGRHGIDYVEFLSSIVHKLGFSVTASGTMDNDLGRHFNFVQPLTWIYGIKKTNHSH